jgi:hypothetical protein
MVAEESGRIQEKTSDRLAGAVADGERDQVREARE